MIRDYDVTGAATHDSVPYPDLIPEEPLFKGQGAYADSAYVGEKRDCSNKMADTYHNSFSMNNLSRNQLQKMFHTEAQRH